MYRLKFREWEIHIWVGLVGFSLYTVPRNTTCNRAIAGVVALLGNVAI